MMHRVRRYDESQPRDMRRTTVAGSRRREGLEGQRPPTAARIAAVTAVVTRSG
jgi:hypothetical protein